MPTFIVDRRFTTHVERTARVLEVAEAFGLGMDESEFVVYDQLKLEIRQGDIVYITGQSGSGKSLLLRDLTTQMAARGQVIANIDQITLPEVPLVDQIGKNTTEALEILSKAGLNDAYLFIRKPSELSDGQRYRLRLAHLMSLEAAVWVADEFGAVLDRTTAKVVAFSMSKVARTLGKTLIVATTHVDLDDELGPNVRVLKRFREKIEMKTQREP